MKDYRKNFEIRDGHICVRTMSYNFIGRTLNKLGGMIIYPINGDYKRIAIQLYDELVKFMSMSENNFFLVGVDEQEKILGITNGVIEGNKARSLHTLAFERGRKIGRTLFDAKLDYAFSVEGVNYIEANPESYEGEKILIKRGFVKEDNLWILTLDKYKHSSASYLF